MSTSMILLSKFLRAYLMIPSVTSCFGSRIVPGSGESTAIRWERNDQIIQHPYTVTEDLIDWGHVDVIVNFYETIRPIWNVTRKV